LLISVPVHLGKCGEHAKLCAVGIQQLIDIPIIGQGGLSCVMTDRTLNCNPRVCGLLIVLNA
jgi:hypothetical protein